MLALKSAKVSLATLQSEAEVDMALVKAQLFTSEHSEAPDGLTIEMSIRTSGLRAFGGSESDIELWLPRG